MNDNNIIDLTVLFANSNVRKYVANAMADVTVEARGRLQYLSECQDDRAQDMKYALHVLEYITSCVAELRTLDG